MGKAGAAMSAKNVRDSLSPEVLAEAIDDPKTRDVLSKVSRGAKRAIVAKVGQLSHILLVRNSQNIDQYSL